MSARANYFKIGIFVVSGAVILIVGIIVLGAGALLQKTIPAETCINESVQGLDIGSPVKYRGVKVGNVEEILFAHNVYGAAAASEERYVLVRLSLDPRTAPFKGASGLLQSLDEEIARGLRVRLASQGLTGAAYLEMDYVDPARHPAPEISWKPQSLYIPSTPSTISRIGQAADKVFQRLENTNIEAVVDHLDEFLLELTQAVKDAEVATVREEAVGVLASLRASAERFQKLMADPALDSLPADASATASSARRIVEAAEGDTKALFEDLRKTSTSLSESAGQIESLLKDERLANGLDSLANAAGNIETATEDLPAVTRRLKITLQRTETLLSRQRADLDAIAANLRAVGENLQAITSDAKRNPARAILGESPSPVEFEP